MHLEDLQHASDHSSFHHFLTVAIRTYDCNAMHEKTLTQLHAASLQTHDFRVTMDCLNELRLYVQNGDEETVDRWRDNVQDIVGSFEVGNEDHFVNFEKKRRAGAVNKYLQIELRRQE